MQWVHAVVWLLYIEAKFSYTAGKDGLPGLKGTVGLRGI